MKFNEEVDGYPWPERGESVWAAASAPPAMPGGSYEPVVSSDDAFDLLESAYDESILTVGLEQEAKRGDRTQDDIDRAMVDGWAAMQREACNDLAKVQRGLWREGDPPILDHDEDECGRCGWKAKTP